MKNYILLFIIIPCLNCCSPTKQAQQNTVDQFVKVQGNQFMVNNAPYYFVGANFWAGMNLGADANGANRERLLRELDKMESIGINNVRIMALTEGPNTAPFRIVPSNNNQSVLNENIMVGLDFLLAEMKKRNMYAVVCLSNFWPWSGGFAQYQQWVGDIKNIDYPMDTVKGDWWKYMQSTANFYASTKAVTLYQATVKKIIERKNTLTNVLYKNDETIMSWQLCNEPRGMSKVEDYLKWIENSAAFIKNLDSNHLVSVGSEGFTSDKKNNGTDFIATHIFKNIDYTTAHLWVQNWGFYNPLQHQSTYSKAISFAIEYIKEHAELSLKLNKPFVLEEFGIMKDSGSFAATASTTHRDDFFGFVFSKILSYAKENKANGVNFWAWGGEGRPRQNGGWWKVGDDFIGDPPHEQQGWYSVYNTDTSTHKIIHTFSKKMAALK
jgi:mannan endo-1,4-beta-mannosidase